MAEHLGKVEEWTTRTLTCACACGWTGMGKETSADVYAGVVALECASMTCERSVADEIRVAAADTQPAAIE